MDEKCRIAPQATYHEMIVDSLEQLGRAIERMDDFVTGLNGGAVKAMVDPKSDAVPTLHQTLRTTSMAVMEHVNHIDGLRDRLDELLYGR